MIISFSIQNFGSIKDKQTLSFEAVQSNHLEQYYISTPIKDLRLLKLGLIYGANASGKTNILLALEFLRNLVLKPEEKKTSELEYNPFLFDGISLKRNSVFTIEFVQNNSCYNYEVEFCKKAIVREELSVEFPNKRNVFKRTTDLDKQLTNIEFGNNAKVKEASESILQANTLWNNTVLGGFLKTNIEVPELKDAVDWFAEYLSSIVYSNSSLEKYVTSRIAKSIINKQDIVNILQKADLGISDIIVKDSVKISQVDLFFEHTVNNSKYELSAIYESEGTLRYYGLAGLLSLLISNSIAIPIDELESSLHPDLFVHFLLTFLLNSKQSQIIATTHNRELLNNPDIYRGDAIWFTDKSDDSATTIYSLSDFDDASNTYSAYKAGKYGAVPNLSDYYLDTADEKE
jgi:AAA15 family ATPase/GTPase